MKSDDRKAAVAAYKKRKSAAGIYAVRCAISGQAWIGQTLNLETIQNRIWFSLRTGGHSNRELQSAWTAHGPEALSFEPLEQLKDEELAYVRDTLLKERFVHWRSALNGLVL
ncbi:MAG: GIY-YIG nuclease family protein [Xanthobacteraceae bacterium]